MHLNKLSCEHHVRLVYPFASHRDSDRWAEALLSEDDKSSIKTGVELTVKGPFTYYARQISAKTDPHICQKNL